MFNQDFQCSTCTSKYLDDTKNGEERNIAMRKAKGCFSPFEKARHKIKTPGFRYQIRLKECPGNYHHSMFYYWWEMLQLYRRGMPIYSGPINKWPAKAMEILSFLDTKERALRIENSPKYPAANVHGVTRSGRSNTNSIHSRR